MPVGNSVSFSE